MELMEHANYERVVSTLCKVVQYDKILSITSRQLSLE